MGSHSYLTARPCQVISGASSQRDLIRSKAMCLQRLTTQRYGPSARTL